MHSNTCKTILLICILFCVTCFSQRKYTVKAWEGIAIRKSPSFSAEQVGKLTYNYKFEVKEEAVGKKDTFIENDTKIKGNWVLIETLKVKGYVFDGFTKRDYNINYNDHYYFFGKVKSFKNFSYYRKEPMKIDDKLIFNERGQITEAFYFYKNTWELDESYVYDENHKLMIKKSDDDIEKYTYIKNTITQLNIRNNTPSRRYIEKYDNKGNMISFESYDFTKDKVDLKSTYKFNSANKCTKKIHYFNGRKSGITLKFKYKKDTILMKKQIVAGKLKRILGERKIKKTDEYKLDKYIEYEEALTLKNSIQRITKRKFNKNDELIEEDIYENANLAPNLEKTNQRTIRFYKNSKLFNELVYINVELQGEEVIGQTIREENHYKQNYSRFIRMDVPISISEYFYDYQGRVLKSTHQYANTNQKEITEYKYTFDTYGNWIKKESFRNGKLYKTELQEFEYY